MENRYNLRAEGRSNGNVPAELFLRRDGSKTFKVDLIDISQFGAQFSHTSDLAIGDICNAVILIPDQDDVIIGTGIIKHKSNKHSPFNYGIQLHFNAEDERSLDYYVMRHI